MESRAVISPVVLALALLCGNGAAAQGAPDGRWHYLVQPYAMFPNMKGETGVGELPAVPVDEDPQDIFDNLQLGAMLYLEVRNDRWTFSSDVLYMDLGADIGGADPPTLLSGEVDVSQIGWELAAMRRVTPWWELGVGMTYNQVDVDVDLTLDLPVVGPTDASGGLEENWIDPTLVSRVTFPIDDHWFFQARGNIGGFGVGSDLMWQLMADVGYRTSGKWLFTFGYRVIDIDYENGSGPDRFVYDMRTFGPVLKAGIDF